MKHKMNSKTLATIVASAVITIAPLINGCNSQKIPVYGPADPNGHREVIGHYRSSHLSTGLEVDTYNPQKKKQDYEHNFP